MWLRMFGIGASAAIAGKRTQGIVTEVKTCWWLKINTKLIRCHAMDGAVFPHVIYFTYTVLEKNYQGKRYVNWNKQCPRKGDKLTVYYEYANPEKYTVIV